MRRARNDLLTYVKWTMPSYTVEPFHHAVADALMAVERGEIRRLMISAPPRHGKTQLVSKRFPLWYLGRNPTRQIIHAGYGGTIAEDAGRELRNLMYSDMHLDVFPDLQPTADSKAVNKWHTPEGGVYIAAGVGGPITGRGFHLGIIDDPVKGHEDADSPVMQEKTWNWYRSDFFSRRMMPNAIVAIGTRWHENDLFGNLLRRMDEGGEQWHVLRFPALGADDEPLAPSRMSLDELQITREESGQRIWQSLYQGDPTPDDGTYFKRDWFWEYDDSDLMVEAGHRDEQGEPVMIARPMQYYGASDYAVSDGEGDYTVHVVVGVDPLENIYLVDLWRGQADSDKWVEQMLDMVERWKPLMWAEEKGQILKAVGPFLEKRTMERNKERTLAGQAPIFVHRQGFTSAADKRTRARAIQQRMAQGKVRFPKGAPWYPELKSEMLKFDAGKNDDQVDAMGLVGRMLAGLTPGRMPGKEARPAATGVALGGEVPLAPGMRPMSLDELWAEEERMRGRRCGRR